MSYVKTNVTDVEDLAPKFGLGEKVSARFARQALGAETIGMAHYEMKPGQRMGFGHRHGEVEEIYLVLGGSGRMKLDDDLVDLSPQDIVYVPPAVVREWESGPDGLQLLAFGGHAQESDAEMIQGWWTD